MGRQLLLSTVKGTKAQLAWTGQQAACTKLRACSCLCMQWDGGRGSHHPDYDPDEVLEGPRASRATVRGGLACCAHWLLPTSLGIIGDVQGVKACHACLQEELYNAIVSNDVSSVYDKIEQVRAGQ
jgi:hypothetical protein